MLILDVKNVIYYICIPPAVLQCWVFCDYLSKSRGGIIKLSMYICIRISPTRDYTGYSKDLKHLMPSPYLRIISHYHMYTVGSVWICLGVDSQLVVCI